MQIDSVQEAPGLDDKKVSEFHEVFSIFVSLGSSVSRIYPKT